MLIGAALWLGGCAPEEPPAAQHERAAKPFQPQSLEEIQAKLVPYDPQGATREALWALNEALEHPEAFDPQTRDRYRWLLAKSGLDLWMRILILESAPEEDSAGRKTLNAWYGLLHAALPAGYASGPSDEPKTVHLIRRMRELVRPVLQHASDPATRAEADTMLRVLDLLGALEDDTQRLRAAQRLRQTPPGASTIATYGYALLALQALRSLDTLPPDAPTDWPLRLATNQGQFCRDAMTRLPSVLFAPDALALLRQRCGLGCSSIPPLGVASEAAQTLDAQTHTRCPAPSMGLPSETKGSYLSFDNYLILQSLNELTAINQGLSALGPETEHLKPLAERFRARLDALIVPGQPPFLGPTPETGGQPGLWLPTLHQARRALQPTPAMVTFDGQTLRVAAWPRFQITTDPQTQSLHPVAHADGAYGYPGVVVGTLPNPGQDWDAAAALAIIEAIQTLDRLPLSANPAPKPRPEAPPKTQPAPKEPPMPTVTLLIDARAEGRALVAIGALLRRAGIKRIQLAAWPAYEDSKHIHRPVMSAVELRIDRPDPFTSRLNVADEDTYLRSPLGKLIARIGLLEVAVYLPDIYAGVEQYVNQNPGLDGLILDVAPTLPIGSLFGLLDALRFQRGGDIMPSARRLLAADPIEDEQGQTTPLMWPLYLGIDPPPPLPPPTPPSLWGLTPNPPPQP